MNDETIFDQNEVKEDPRDNEVMNNDETVVDEQQTPNMEAASNDKKKHDFKTAGIAGAAGVAGAALGVLTLVNVFPDGPDEGSDIDDIVVDDADPAPCASHHLQGHDMEVATGVNDSMSFNQAFAAARQEVGPGGLFSMARTYIRHLLRQRMERHDAGRPRPILGGRVSYYFAYTDTV